jgi:hypothetical protein
MRKPSGGVISVSAKPTRRLAGSAAVTLVSPHVSNTMHTIRDPVLMAVLG